MGGGGSAAQPQLLDPDRPRYHVHPPQGWMNDPNGPVFYKGRYHMFYQHLPNACEWAFGIVWGHAVSSNLVHWEHLPPALVPTPGTLDADGCFSGSCVLDSDGTPVLLYTGVRLRSNPEAGPLPPPEQDLGMVWVETQMAAVPEDPDDELLVRWRKVESPFLHLPPTHLQLTGWRDPFVFVTNTAAAPTEAAGFQANGYSRDIRMLIGSGLKGQGGTALVYKSRSLLGGWELEGTLCEASNTDTGVVWECPLLVPLDPVPRTMRAPHKHMPPGWLVLGKSAPSGGERGGGKATGSCSQVVQEHGALGGRGGSARSTLQLALAGTDAPPTAAAAAAGAGPTAGGAAAPPVVVSAADEAAAAAAEEGQREVVVAHQRTSSFAFDQDADGFAFDQDPSAESLALGEEASSAVLAWHLQSGSSTAASPLAVGPAAAHASPPAAAAPPDPEAPSDTETLPPGRRRAPVAGAKLVLESAVTLEHWSRTNSIDPSPADPLSIDRSSGLMHGSQAGLASPAKPSCLDGQQKQAQQQPAAGAGAGGADSRPDSPASSSGDSGSSMSLHLGSAASGSGQQLQAQEDEDRFAAAFSRVRSIRARKRSKERSAAHLASLAAAAESSELAAAAAREAWGAAAIAAVAVATASEEGDEAIAPAPPTRQWHFFTVSPDAPTNPVLYWMGHVQDTEGARFELEGAKGPYRLDLGDVLYAPNVCQDDQGRWLLWGWLQERRKVGSYNYAGCLTLPRVLHCTEDGRLVQAPVPELSALRQGPGWRQHGVHVPAKEAVQLKAPAGVPALDIELTIDRGSAYAAGLLFRSYEAEAEGGTALVYDWDRNSLEAIFNVPPNWQPQAAVAAASASTAGEEEHFDPALLLTPRPSVSNFTSMAGLSRDPSAIFAPDGFIFESPSASASATPRTATASLAGELSSSVLSPQRGGITIAGVPQVPSLDLGIPGLPPPPHLEDATALGTSLGNSSSRGLDFRGLEFARTTFAAGAHFVQSLPRSLSAIPAGFLGAGGGGGAAPAAGAGGGGLYRSVSDGRTALGAMTRIGSQPALAQMGSNLPRLGSSAGGACFVSPRRSPQPPQPLGQDTDADLDFLLDELAAPMREAPPPVVEPRRVGGPLPLMHPADVLHLRILVDHSCIEVYTGTGEALSTRIYRGQAPEGCADSGISFIAFGGTAYIKRCATYEMGSAWQQEKVAAGAAMASAAATPKQPATVAPVAHPAGGSRGGSVVTSPAAAASGMAPPPAGAEPAADDDNDMVAAAAAAAQLATATALAVAADALLDELVMTISPQCSSTTLVGAFS